VNGSQQIRQSVSSSGALCSVEAIWVRFASGSESAILDLCAGSLLKRADCAQKPNANAIPKGKRFGGCIYVNLFCQFYWLLHEVAATSVFVVFSGVSL
jgi:hypothetical protein